MSHLPVNAPYASDNDDFVRSIELNVKELDF